MIFYTENFEHSTKKMLELIVRKLLELEINIKNQLCFYILKMK